MSVFAERGHVTHARLHVGEGGRRQQRHGRGVFGADGAPAIALTQLRVIEDLVEMLDLCGGNSRCRQAAIEVSRSPAHGIGGDDSVAFVGGLDLARRYCDSHPGTLALITPDDGSNRPLVVGRYLGASVDA